VIRVLGTSMQKYRPKNRGSATHQKSYMKELYKAIVSLNIPIKPSIIRMQTGIDRYEQTCVNCLSSLIIP